MTRPIEAEDAITTFDVSPAHSHPRTDEDRRRTIAFRNMLSTKLRSQWNDEVLRAVADLLGVKET